MNKKVKGGSLKKDPEIKRCEVFQLELTKFELLHLRDLMGILLPPDGSSTVSQALASTEDRSLIETILWDKVSKLCKVAKLPLESAAPDYIIAPISPPPMGVFQINQNLQNINNESLAGFLSHEDDEETNQEVEKDD